MTSIPYALVNLGFDYHEALFEAIDDSIDAAGSENIEVKCYFLKEMPDSQEQINYSYLCLDNSGGADLSRLFNVQSEITFAEKYPTKESLVMRTGLFGAGSLSHLNVSEDVWIFTKKNNNWFSMHLIKDDDTGGFKRISSEDNPTEVLSKLCHEDLDDWIHESDTILYVRNVDLSNNNFCQTFDYKTITNSLQESIRFTFANHLAKGVRITFNSSDLLEELNPFCFDDDEKMIESFFCKQITLRQLTLEHPKYRTMILRRFQHLMSEEELLNQSLKVELFKINKELYNDTFGKNHPNNIVPLNSENSGFWIYRNGRKIGTPAKIHGINKQHDDYNIFRGRIEFSPIFDEFFGIQVNKNRYTINPIFTNKLSELLKDNNITSSRTTALGSYIKRSNDKPVDLEVLLEKTITSFENEINRAKSLNIDVGKFSEAITSYENSSREINQADVQILSGNVSDLKGLISQKERDIIEPRKKLLNRFEKAVEQRKALSINEEGENILKSGLIIEPINESEVVLNLYLALNLFPEKFDFRILDYKDSDGIDCVITNLNGMDYSRINMKERLEISLPRYKGNNIKISYLECKNILTDSVAINHSLALVSHLVCWEIERELGEVIVTSVMAEDGKYDLNEIDGKMVLRSSSASYGGVEKVVYLIELKKVFEEYTNEEFESSAKHIEQYLLS